MLWPHLSRVVIHILDGRSGPSLGGPHVREWNVVSGHFRIADRRAEAQPGATHDLATDNEEHSIGGARWLKLRRWKESVRRALPIEFVELSRTGTYGD
jgi:hypothetical protein